MATKEELKEERDKIVKGLEEAYRRLVEYNRLTNTPMVVMEDEKIVEVDPHDMPATIKYKRNTD